MNLSVPVRIPFSLLCLLILSAGVLMAQIPNAGFESWTSGEPDSWYTSNATGITSVTQSATSHSGSSAAQGAVVTFFSFAYSPYLFSGTPDNPGFAISQRYAGLHGFYRFAPAGGDKFIVTVLMRKNSAGIGGGIYQDSVDVSSYREFIAPITYTTADVPDSVTITFTITGPGGTPHVGSTFLIDDLSFGAASGVHDPTRGIPAEFSLGQNYPNPFNPSTSISYALPEEAPVTLTVTDITGRVVATPVNGRQPAGTHLAIIDGSGLGSGVYFYSLRAGSRSATGKMLLMK